MAVTLAKLLSDSTIKTRNSTTGALDNEKRTISINTILQDLQDFGDWDFTKRTKTFYFIDGIYEYSLKNYIGCECQDTDGSTLISDFKSPYDLRPIDVTGKSLNFREVRDVRQDVRRNRFNYEYSVENDLLVMGYPDSVSLQLHNCDSLTADGTWGATTGASNLTIDSIVFDEGNGALNFDTVAGTSLVITNSTMAVKDLSALQNKSHLTMKVWLPTITNFTSIRVRLGSASGAYWEKTETVPAGERALVAGKNTFAFRWADSTETGTPDYTAVDYIQIVITYSGATTATDFRIDDIRIGEEVEFELEYYSLAMVQDTAGDYQLEFNSDSVTQTDILLGGNTARLAVVKGTAYELFSIIGGKSERDRTDSYKEYQDKKIDLLKKAGHRLKRASRVLNFQRR